MKRNDDRYWYDKGYSDGVQNTRKESKLPKTSGIICLCALLFFDQYWVLGFVILYLAFEIEQWYDLNKRHESDPPDLWQ